MCTKCRQWICGFCNHNKDPYFTCERSEDSEYDQYDEVFDDSDSDKDFDSNNV